MWRGVCGAHVWVSKLVLKVAAAKTLLLLLLSSLWPSIV